MPLTQLHRQKFTTWWIAIFYLLAIVKFVQGLWLYQFHPFMFTTRFDGITWLFMQTGIHLLVLNNNWLAIVLDILFYGFPALYFIAFLKKPGKGQAIAWAWLLVNWLYVQCYTLFPTNSIEAHIPWLLFPLLFASQSLRSFFFIMHGLRYFFLYFFFSAGVWKLVNGGAFEPTQMGAILMDQHKEFLITAPGNWQATFIYQLIAMPLAAFLLYWLSIITELFFGVGFFSRRFDRVLVFLFLLFLVFDYLIMRIPYIEVVPFLLTFLFSKYGVPVEAGKHPEKKDGS